jgi:hypothetical protein
MMHLIENKARRPFLIDRNFDVFKRSERAGGYVPDVTAVAERIQENP